MGGASSHIRCSCKARNRPWHAQRELSWEAFVVTLSKGKERNAILLISSADLLLHCPPWSL